MTIEARGEESVLAGNVFDRAQLQGLIRWLSDLRIGIVSINPLPTRRDEP
jgi:hypothetical protein